MLYLTDILRHVYDIFLTFGHIVRIQKGMGVFFLIIVGILNLLYITEGSMVKGQHFNPNRHAC